MCLYSAGYIFSLEDGKVQILAAEAEDQQCVRDVALVTHLGAREMINSICVSYIGVRRMCVESV